MDHIPIPIPFSLSLIIITFLILFQSTKIQAQTPTQSPSGPTNITKILSKAGQFTTLIRLLQTTQIGEQINTQLNNSNQGLTVFAPTDTAFSGLKPGTLNSLSDQQKVSLIQFHIIPTFLSTSQFQTISNPLRTQAGNNVNGEFPLNVTTSGNQVNISTGVNDATVANTIYTDNQLAVYQVDKVLLPLSIFASPSPAAAPAVSTPKNKSGAADSPVTGNDDVPDASGGVGRVTNIMHGVVVLGVAMVWTSYYL